MMMTTTTTMMKSSIPRKKERRERANNDGKESRRTKTTGGIILPFFFHLVVVVVVVFQNNHSCHAAKVKTATKIFPRHHFDGRSTNYCSSNCSSSNDKSIDEASLLQNDDETKIKGITKTNHQNNNEKKNFQLELVDTTITNPCTATEDSDDDYYCFGDVYNYLLDYELVTSSSSSSYPSLRPWKGTLHLLNNHNKDDKKNDDDDRIVMIHYTIKNDIDEIHVYQQDCQSSTLGALTIISMDTVLQEENHQSIYIKVNLDQITTEANIIAALNNNNDDDEEEEGVLYYPYCVVLHSTIHQQSSYLSSQFQITTIL